MIEMPDDPGPSEDPSPPEGGHHHHGRGGRRTTSDYARDFFENWRSYQGPLAEKVRLTLMNRFRAYAPPIRGCCGHPGEPGC
jgi:hypothetical protein